jgi:hypothetical protein
MAIKFQCPECKKAFSINDECAGKKAKCKCGARMVVPSNPMAHSHQPATTEAQESHAGSREPDEQIIRFVCTECGKLIKVLAKHSGEKSKCPCGAQIVVPFQSNILEKHNTEIVNNRDQRIKTTGKLETTQEHSYEQEPIPSGSIHKTQRDNPTQKVLETKKQPYRETSSIVLMCLGFLFTPLSVLLVMSGRIGLLLLGIGGLCFTLSAISQLVLLLITKKSDRESFQELRQNARTQRKTEIAKMDMDPIYKAFKIGVVVCLLADVIAIPLVFSSTSYFNFLAVPAIAGCAFFGIGLAIRGSMLQKRTKN